MKRILLSLFAFSIYLISFSQNAPKADSKVESFFGETKIKQWNQQHPDSIAYYNFFVGHSFEVIKKEYLQPNLVHADTKTLKLSEIETQTLISKPSEFNILSLELLWDLDQTIVFLIDGTEYCLLLHPLNYINQKFQAGK